MNSAGMEYGTALFALAKEENTVAEYEASLKLVGEAFEENPEYIELLASPNIPAAERTGLIDKAFEGSVNGDVLSFLKILCEQNYVRNFFACKEEFDRLAEDDRKMATAIITSAAPLSEEEKEKLLVKLEGITGRTVNPVYKIDTSLLGGLVVETGGKVLDGSLKRQMQNIKGVIK